MRVEDKSVSVGVGASSNGIGCKTGKPEESIKHGSLEPRLFASSGLCCCSVNYRRAFGTTSSFRVGANCLALMLGGIHEPIL